MKPASLFGTGIRSYSQVACSQRRLNCYYDLRPDGDKSAVIVRGTPGEVLWLTLPATVRGWRVVDGFLYVVAGPVLYKISTTGVIVQMGTLNSAYGIVDMSDNFVQLVIVDGVAGYVLTLVAGTYSGIPTPVGTFATISDVNFPGVTALLAPTSITFLDGRFIVNTPQTRQFFVSASQDATNWGAYPPEFVMYGTKESASDLLIAVDSYNDLIYLWGTQTMEFWQDVGAPTLPYSRISGATQTVGLLAINSRAVIHSQGKDVMLFLGVTEQGAAQVFGLNGFSPTPVSTPDIDQIINTISKTNPISDATALTYSINGHDFYQLTFPSAQRSLLLDMTTSIWQETQTGMGAVARHNGSLGISFGTRALVSDYATGNIYQLSDTAYTDNGTLIKRQVATRHLRSNGNEFTIDEVFLDMDTGDALQVGQGSAPQIVMQKSKDGGRTFGYERWKPLGTVGQYLAPRVIWRRNGRSRDFVFMFTMTDPVPFIVAGAALTADGSTDDGK